MKPSTDDRPEGILVVGHGTRDRRGTDEFFAFGDRLADRTELPVVASLLEFQQPTIAQGWRMLVDRGVRHVHVTPLLLFAAGHARQDVPEEIAAAAAETPDVTHDQCGPLSRSPEMVTLACERITHTMSSQSLDPQRTAVVVVGRGSHHPCATSDLRVFSELVRHRCPAAGHDTAFYAMAEPRLPEILDRVASSGRWNNVVVYPHLLFNGRLYEAIMRQTDEAGGRHPSIRFVVTDYLGPVDGVVDATLRRIGRPVPATVGV